MQGKAYYLYESTGIKDTYCVVYPKQLWSGHMHMILTVKNQSYHTYLG